MTLKIKNKCLPLWFRDEVLKSLLYQSQWTNPRTSNFSNLDVFSEFLKIISQEIEGGHVLLLNFVFQNIVASTWKENQEEGRLEDGKSIITRRSIKMESSNDTLAKAKIFLGNKGFASYKQVAEALEECLLIADEQLTQEWENNPQVEKVMLKVGRTLFLYEARFESI